MNLKSLKVFFGIIALGVAVLLGESVASAQVTEIVKDYTNFTTVTVDHNYDVTIVPSTDYKVVIKVDEPYVDFVQCYVKGSALVISLAKVPKEVTKLYKGKDAPKPTFNAVVYTPSFGGAELADNAVLSATEVLEADNISLVLAGKSQIKNLSVQAASVNVNSSKSAMLTLTADADEINLNTAGSSSTKLNFSCDKLNINSKNSSSISAVGETYVTNITSENSSKIVISGESSNTLNVRGSGSSNVDASALATEEAVVNLSNSSTLSESAKDKLQVELAGNSTLLFGGDPVVNIVSIKSSTMQRR